MNNEKYIFNFQGKNKEKYQNMASSEDQNSNHMPQVWIEISRIELKYYIMENFNGYWKYRK